MKFKEYREQTKRTLPDLGSVILNSIHMTLGMGSETYELTHAMNKGDLINVGEELTDKAWYASNYCNIRGIEVETPVRTLNTSFIDLQTCVDEVVHIESYLQDLDKKEFAYNREETPHIKSERARYINRYLDVLSYFYCNLRLDAEVCMRNNIDKLRARFPDKFNNESANNRDLEAERKQLEKE